MNRRILRYIFLAGFVISFVPRAFADDVTWKNYFTFYADNTEFFEPYRLRETILGQQGKTWLEAGLGGKDFLTAGVFADYRSVTDPDLTVKPLISFEYREGGTQLIMGSLQTVNRHGFLEPLEVTTLEFTRPVEYGAQWLQKDPDFHADLFLNWQLLNTPGVPETFDYGWVAKFWPDSPLSLEFQYHGYHEGGKLYYVTVYNNYVPALGLRFKTPLGSLGDLHLDAFGIASGTMKDGWNVNGIDWGQGGYAKAALDPGNGWEFFAIGWTAHNFLSQEGDYNYNSYSQYQNFYQANRSYEEIGGQKSFPLEGGASFVTEARSHWIDDFWAYSFRLAVYAPFDVPVYKKKKTEKNEDHDSNS